MKTLNPVIFPHEGEYSRSGASGIHVDFDCLTPNAAVYYTVDGTEPTVLSRRFSREEGLATLLDVPSVLGRPNRETVTVKAIAVAEGLEPSEVVTANYTICRRPSESYISELLHPLSAEQPALLRMLDCEDDNMFLLVGTERALLIDTGVDEIGDLAGYIRTIIGDMPLDAVITHGHIDHYGQAWKLRDAGVPVYMNHADLPIVEELFGRDLSFTLPLHEGDTFDLGNTVLRCYTVCGHTSGGTVLVDEKSGDIFAGDAFGSTRNAQPDSLLIHFGNPEGVVDYFLPSLVKFMHQTEGKRGNMYTGHNAVITDTETHLRVLAEALQQAADEGDKCLKSALRPMEDGVTSSPRIIYVGNHRIGNAWTAINVGDSLFSDGLTSENLSLLADLQVSSGTLEPAFEPHCTEYLWHGADNAACLTVQPLSSRVSGMEINGKIVHSSERVPVSGDCAIAVTAPDGKSQTVYRIKRG